MKSILATLTLDPSSPPSLHSTLDLANQLFVDIPILLPSLSTKPMPIDLTLVVDPIDPPPYSYFNFSLCG